MVCPFLDLVPITPSSTGTSGWSNGFWTSTAVTVLAATGDGYTITANDGLGHTGTDTFNVVAGALYQFSFSTIGSQTSGTAFSVTITAQDQYGNKVTSYQRTPTLVAQYSGGSGTLTPTTVTFVNGVCTVQVKITISGNHTAYLYINGYQNDNNSNTFDLTNSFCYL